MPPDVFTAKRQIKYNRTTDNNKSNKRKENEKENWMIGHARAII